LNVQHPNLVQLFDYSHIGNEHVLVMEFIDGLSLKDLPLTDLTDELIAYIGIEVLGGLSALHEAQPYPILHRDISPGNILVDRNGTVKVTDFGIACLLDDPASKRQTQARGTWRYLPPERRGGFPLFPSSDLYSLGVVLAELAGGAPTGPIELDVHLERWLDDVASKGHGELIAAIRPWMAALPQQRPTTAREARERLLLLVTHSLRWREALASIVTSCVAESRPGTGEEKLPKRQTAVLGASEPDLQVIGAHPKSNRTKAGRKVSSKSILMAVLALLLVAMASLRAIGTDKCQRPVALKTVSNDFMQPESLLTFDAKTTCGVVIDDELIGQTPLKVFVAPGRHLIKCERANSTQVFEKTFFLLPGANPEIYFR
jgi:serine/threonine-protein kinase